MVPPPRLRVGMGIDRCPQALCRMWQLQLRGTNSPEAEDQVTKRMRPADTVIVPLSTVGQRQFRLTTTLPAVGSIQHWYWIGGLRMVP